MLLATLIQKYPQKYKILIHMVLKKGGKKILQIRIPDRSPRHILSYKSMEELLETRITVPVIMPGQNGDLNIFYCIDLEVNVLWNKNFI